MRIVTNLALNFRRARARRPTVSTDDLVEGQETLRTLSGAVLDLAPADDASPDARELKAAVAAAIDALPEKQRLCLVLFSVEGMPQKEVASILDCTVELVKWNVFQARKALKKALAEYLED
jgi:RNA polymerase sigma factor (sigma-70 family)